MKALSEENGRDAMKCSCAKCVSFGQLVLLYACGKKDYFQDAFLNLIFNIIFNAFCLYQNES